MTRRSDVRAAVPAPRSMPWSMRSASRPLARGAKRQDSCADAGRPEADCPVVSTNPCQRCWRKARRNSSSRPSALRNTSKSWVSMLMGHPSIGAFDADVATALAPMQSGKLPIHGTFTKRGWFCAPWAEDVATEYDENRLRRQCRANSFKSGDRKCRPISGHGRDCAPRRWCKSTVHGREFMSKGAVRAEDRCRPRGRAKEIDEPSWESRMAVV